MVDQEFQRKIEYAKIMLEKYKTLRAELIVTILKNSHLYGREAFSTGEKLTVITQHLGLSDVRVFDLQTGQREEREGISSGIIPVSGSALEQKYLRNFKKFDQLSFNNYKTILYSTQSCNL